MGKSGFCVLMGCLLFFIASCNNPVENNKCALPTFTPSEGTYTSQQYVTISSTIGTSIFYTVDGSMPSSSSSEYLYPILLAQDTSTIIRAQAFREGWENSDVASATFNITGTVSSPYYDIPGGIYFNTIQVGILCETEGAIIRYTTDGSEPTEISNLYHSSITMNRETTLKAIAYRTGWNNSPTSSTLYRFKMQMPTCYPIGGEYLSPQIVSIDCPSTYDDIRYTTDGSEPSSLSPIYLDEISISAYTMLKAKAFRNGWIDSDSSSNEYFFKVSTPQFSPTSGTYTSTISSTISTDTPGTTIRYTIDGSIPSETSLMYTQPIDISHTIIVIAQAFKDGWIPSELGSAIYVIQR